MTVKLKKGEAFWKDSIGGCVDAVRIDPGRKEQTLKALSHAAEEKKLLYQPGRLENWRMQLSCLTGRTIVEQICFLLLIPGIEQLLIRHTGVRGWEIFPALSVWMAVGCLVLAQELSVHFSTHMAELEQSCYFNLSQLWLTRAVSISGLDVLAVLALGGVRSQAYGYGWFPFAVYVLTPFFTANAVMLFVISQARGKNRVSAAVIVFLAGAGFALQAGLPWIYEKTWLSVWLFLLAAAASLCVYQMKKLCGKIEGRGESICWN